jgi:hypothetical protein
VRAHVAAGFVPRLSSDLLPLPARPPLQPLQLHEFAVDLRAPAPGAPPPGPPLRRLRSSADLALGGPLAHAALHPGGRHLVALSRGSGAVHAVDLKLLLASRRLGRVKAGVGPFKLAASPGA